MTFYGVYAITDDRLQPPERMLESVQQALQGGISLLQYRSKNPDRDQLLKQARLLAAMCQQYSVPLLINDDIQLCLDCGANGVHLGQSDASVAAARAQLGDKAIIGVTCHDSVKLALLAQQQGASYAAFGRFFVSQTKPSAPAAELTVLTKAKSLLTIPLIAIGGINANNGASVIEAGADMIAVIDFLFAGADTKSRARQLVKLFSSSAN